MDSCDLKKIETMWKYELEYRIDKPETEGETDKHFDLDNYKDWLEEQLTNCRKQLSILLVSKSFTSEEVVNELEDCDTLDDAIMFFKEQM